MHLQRLAADQSIQQVAPFALQQAAPFFLTQTTTTDRQTSLLPGSDGHVLGVLREASSRVRVIVLDVLGKPLLAELWVGQGLCMGLDMSLFDVVGAGLTTCEPIGVVKESIFFQAKHAVPLRKFVKCTSQLIENSGDIWSVLEFGRFERTTASRATRVCLEVPTTACSRNARDVSSLPLFLGGLGLRSATRT